MRYRRKPVVVDAVMVSEVPYSTYVLTMNAADENNAGKKLCNARPPFLQLRWQKERAKPEFKEHGGCGMWYR